jgi:hypothetical protein
VKIRRKIFKDLMSSFLMEDKEEYSPEEAGSMVSMAYNLGMAKALSNCSESESLYRDLRDKVKEQIPKNVRTSGVCPLELNLRD